jgi:hypothetical protein
MSELIYVVKENSFPYLSGAILFLSGERGWRYHIQVSSVSEYTLFHPVFTCLWMCAKFLYCLNIVCTVRWKYFLCRWTEWFCLCEFYLWTINLFTLDSCRVSSVVNGRGYIDDCLLQICWNCLRCPSCLIRYSNIIKPSRNDWIWESYLSSLFFYIVFIRDSTPCNSLSVLNTRKSNNWVMFEEKYPFSMSVHLNAWVCCLFDRSSNGHFCESLRIRQNRLKKCILRRSFDTENGLECLYGYYHGILL